MVSNPWSLRSRCSDSSHWTAALARACLRYEHRSEQRSPVPGEREADRSAHPHARGAAGDRRGQPAAARDAVGDAGRERAPPSSGARLAHRRRTRAARALDAPVLDLTQPVTEMDAMYTNVIVGIDGGPGGRNAAALAASLVASDGHLTLVHVS